MLALCWSNACGAGPTLFQHTNIGLAYRVCWVNYAQSQKMTISRLPATARILVQVTIHRKLLIGRDSRRKYENTGPDIQLTNLFVLILHNDFLLV